MAYGPGRWRGVVQGRAVMVGRITVLWLSGTVDSVSQRPPRVVAVCGDQP